MQPELSPMQDAESTLRRLTGWLLVLSVVLHCWTSWRPAGQSVPNQQLTAQVAVE
jgi:hypothetical protein